jgi:hypothetical protein
LKINDVIVAATVPDLNRSDLNARHASQAYGVFGNSNMASHVLFDKLDISWWPTSNLRSSSMAILICLATVAFISTARFRTRLEAKLHWFRLPKTGLIVLTSDVCYLKESLDKDILPSIGLTYDPTGMLDAYHYIKQAVDREKGDVIFAHDPDTFKAHRIRLSSTNSRLIFQSMPSTRAADLCCRPAFLGSR